MFWLIVRLLLGLFCMVMAMIYASRGDWGPANWNLLLSWMNLRPLGDKRDE